MSYRIDKVGIVGAGTMGGGIAAHLANIGIPVVLSLIHISEPTRPY